MWNIKKLESLKKKISEIRSCELKKNANNLVFGDGNINSKIMIVGGNGSDALCSAILDVDNPDKSKRTSIKKIEIKNSGRNYNSTPKVLIENPSSNHKCKLCCK